MIRALIILALLSLTQTPARAGPPATGSKALTDAFAAVDAAARGARAKGGLPRLSEAHEAAVLEKFWDVDAILGTSPYAAGDVPYLLDVMQKETLLAKTYLYFAADPAQTPATDRNAFVFQDEITRSYAVLVRTWSALSEAMGRFVAGLKPGEFTETRKQGLRQSRLGLVQFVSGAALMLRSPGYKPENQALLVAAMADGATPLAAAMAPQDRKAMIANAESALDAVKPEVRARLQAFIDAIGAAPCEGLCLAP